MATEFLNDARKEIERRTEDFYGELKAFYQGNGEATGLLHLLKSLTTHLRNLLLMRNLGSTERHECYRTRCECRGMETGD